MRRPASRESDAAGDYAAGLNYLVSGETNLALEKLKSTVRKDTDNIDAYIKIGDILRENGKVDQAIKVHRDLTARTSLSLADQLLILRSLEADFEQKQAYDSALKVLEKIYELKKTIFGHARKSCKYMKRVMTGKKPKSFIASSQSKKISLIRRNWLIIALKLADNV